MIRHEKSETLSARAENAVPNRFAGKSRIPDFYPQNAVIEIQDFQQEIQRRPGVRGMVDDDPPAVFPYQRIEDPPEPLFPGKARPDMVTVIFEPVFVADIEKTAGPGRAGRGDMKPGLHDPVAIRKTVVFRIGRFQDPFRQGREKGFTLDEREIPALFFGKGVCPFGNDLVPVQRTFEVLPVVLYAVLLGAGEAVFPHRRERVIGDGGIIVGKGQQFVTLFQDQRQGLGLGAMGVGSGSDPFTFFPVGPGIGVGIPHRETPFRIHDFRFFVFLPSSGRESQSEAPASLNRFLTWTPSSWDGSQFSLTHIDAAIPAA